MWTNSVSGCLVDRTFENGGRWIEVRPPDGSANIALALRNPVPTHTIVGGDSQIYFVTEDIWTKYKE